MSACKCRDVEIGSYDAQVELVPPPFLRREDGRGICVDACLALEISKLWARGIATTGCCCGHNKKPAYIGVVETDVLSMKRLGYRVLENRCRPGAEDSFSPMSVPRPQPTDDRKEA